MLGEALIKAYGVKPKNKQKRQLGQELIDQYGVKPKANRAVSPTSPATKADAQQLSAPQAAHAPAFGQPIVDAAKQAAALAQQQITQRQADIRPIQGPQIPLSVPTDARYNVTPQQQPAQNIWQQALANIASIPRKADEMTLERKKQALASYPVADAVKKQALEKQLAAYPQDAQQRRAMFLQSYVPAREQAAYGTRNTAMRDYNAQEQYLAQREQEYQNIWREYTELDAQARWDAFTKETGYVLGSGNDAARAAAEQKELEYQQKAQELLKAKGKVLSYDTSVEDLLKQKEAYTPEQVEVAKQLVEQFEKAHLSSDPVMRNYQIKNMPPQEKTRWTAVQELKNRIDPMHAATMGAASSATFGLGKLFVNNASHPEFTKMRVQAARKQGNEDLAKLYEVLGQGNEGVNIAERDAQQHPFAYNVGSFVGSGIGYAKAAKVVASMPRVGKVAQAAGQKISGLTGGRISAEVATGLVSGRIADLPGDVTNAAVETIENGDNFYDFVKKLAGDQAAGLLMDGSIEMLSAGYRMIKQKLGKGTDVKMTTPTAPQNLRDLENANPGYYDLIKKKPVKVVDLPDIGQVNDYKSLRNDLMTYARDNGYFDKPIINKDTGVPIFITNKALKHSMNNAGDMNKAQVEALPQLIENAVFVGKNYPKAKDTLDALDGSYTLLSAVRQFDDAGEYYIPVKLTVKEYRTSDILRLSKELQGYFNEKGFKDLHAKLYDSRILLAETIENVENIKRSANRYRPAGSKTHGDLYLNTNPTISIEDLLGTVKGDAKKYIPTPGGPGTHQANAPVPPPDRMPPPTQGGGTGGGGMSAKEANELAGQRFAEAAVEGLKKGGLEQQAAKEANAQAGKRFVEAIAEGPEMGAKRREAFARGLSIQKDGSIAPDIVRTVETPEQTASLLTDSYNKRYRLSNQLEHAKKALGLPDDVIEKAWHPVTGEFIEKYLPEGVDPEKVMKYQEINAQLQETNNVIRDFNIQRRQTLLDQMESLIESSDAWEDKKIGFLYSRETPERNIRDIVGKENQEEAARIIRDIYDPIHKNEAAKTRFVKYFNDKLKGFGSVSKKQREYIQKLGEGLISKADIPAKLDPNKIERIMITMRDEIYPELLKFENQVRVLNGYPPIGKIDNYFAHFLEPETMWSKLAAKFGKSDGTPRAKSSLPTEIAGITENRRPGTRFSAHDLKRKGTVTVYDAFEGFQGYIEEIADKIYHTDDIQRLRMFETAIRTKYSEPGVRKRVLEALHSNLPMDEIEQRVQDILQNGNTDKLPKFVTNLRDYTNNLAGKKSLADREWEHEMGREIYTLTKKFEGRVAANMVGGNLASAATNFIPIVQSNIKKKNIIRGMGCAVGSSADDFVSLHSTFLINRAGSGKLAIKKLDAVSDALGKPMEMVDMFTSRTIVYGKYFDNLEKGMKPQAALDAADKYAASLMADRSKGALPTQFNKTNPFAKTLNMFQVEVNNQLSYFFKDLPREERKHKIAGLCGSIASIAVGSYLFNDVYEKVVGRRPAFDPIDYINEAVGDSTGYQLPNTVDAVVGAAQGKPLALESKEKPSVYKAGVGLAKNVTENMPFVGGLMGGGRVPVSSALPDVSGLWKNVTGAASGDIPTNKAMDGIAKSLSPVFYNTVLPFGGGQIKKTIEGVQAVKNKGVYSIDSKGRKQLDYAVKPDWWNVARAGMFGRYATDEGHAFAEGGFKSALGAEDTEAMEKLEGRGIDRYKSIPIIQELRAVKADPDNGKNKTDMARQALMNRTDLTPAQKLEMDKALLSGGERGDYKNKYAFAVSQLSDTDRERWSYPDVQKAAGSIESYQKILSAVKNVEGEKDEYGNEISGTARQNKVQAIAEALQISEQKADDIYKELYQSKHALKDFSSDVQRKYDTVFKNQGVSKDEFVKYMRAIGGVKADDQHDVNQNRVAALMRSGVGRQKANSFVNDMFVKKHSVDELEDTQKEKLENLRKSAKISDTAFLYGINTVAGVSGDKDRNGKTVSGSLKMNRYAALRGLGWNHSAAKIFLMELYGYKDKDWT